jgi:hypothetical protein
VVSFEERHALHETTNSARHEAIHAVLAVVLGLHVGEIRIQATEDGSVAQTVVKAPIGWVQVDDEWQPANPADPAHRTAVARWLVPMVGPIAAQVIYGVDLEVESDHLHSSALLAKLQLEDEATYVRALLNEARALVTSNQNAIEAVAGALIKHKHLDGDQVRQIVVGGD